ncbi:MAG: alkene reductase [Alphaproteobacteria bacterium]
MSIDLFTPLQMGPLLLPNRIVMAPLTRNRCIDTVPGPLQAEYYSQRASAAFIISEATQISPQGIGYPNTPGIYTPEQIAGWRRVTDAVHAAGGRMFLQLWHVGRISHPSLQPDGALPVAPSAIKPAGEAFTYEGLQPFVTPRALELDEIPGLIDDYRQATLNAREAGFDGVEVHAANGYLLDQFLRDGTNRRTDQYGGSIENRARLLLEVLQAVTGAWQAERVGVRLSPLNPFNDIRDSNPEATFSYVTEALNPFGLAYLHVTEWGADDPGAAGPPFDIFKLREIFERIYMTNGGYDKARANAVLAAGKADLVAFGKLFIANPDLVERFAKDAPLNEPDESTFYGGDAHGYTDYPFLDQ